MDHNKSINVNLNSIVWVINCLINLLLIWGGMVVVKARGYSGKNLNVIF